jgi:hypothetical protein
MLWDEHVVLKIFDDKLLSDSYFFFLNDSGKPCFLIKAFAFSAFLFDKRVIAIVSYFLTIVTPSNFDFLMLHLT